MPEVRIYLTGLSENQMNLRKEGENEAIAKSFADTGGCSVTLDFQQAHLRTSGVIFKIALGFGDIFRNH